MRMDAWNEEHDQIDKISTFESTDVQVQDFIAVWNLKCSDSCIKQTPIALNMSLNNGK